MSDQRLGYKDRILIATLFLCIASVGLIEGGLLILVDEV